MNNQPLVSVILPTHNRVKYIRKAIESVLGQTYRNLELIIINDGSDDKTSDVIHKFTERDQRVKNVKNEINIGLVKSLNKGITKSKGKYIARIDDDDFWCDKEKLEKQVRFLENNLDYVAVGGGVIKVNLNGKEVAKHLLTEKNKDIKNAMLLNNSFVHSSVMFRKNAIDCVGGYNPELSSSNSEDWDLWLKLGKLGKFYNFQEYFVYYSQDYHNKTNHNIRNSAWVNIKLREKYRKDYPHFWKSYILGWAQYFYTFLPFRRFLKGRFSRLRMVIFGNPGYKSFIK